MSAIRSFDADTVEKMLKSDFETKHPNTHHDSVLHTAVTLMDANTSSFRLKHFEEKVDKHPNPLFNPDAVRRIVELLIDTGQLT